MPPYRSGFRAAFLTSCDRTSSESLLGFVLQNDTRFRMVKFETILILGGDRQSPSRPAIIIPYKRPIPYKSEGPNGSKLTMEEDGRARSPCTVSKAFEYLLEKNDLPHLRFHDLRHSHATLLLERGVHIKIVPERLGHSSVNLTLDTYSHVLLTMQDEAARQVNKALNDALDRRKTRENKGTLDGPEEER